jgi:hypothetical protein
MSIKPKLPSEILKLIVSFIPKPVDAKTLCALGR